MADEKPPVVEKKVDEPEDINGLKAALSAERKRRKENDVRLAELEASGQAEAKRRKDEEDKRLADDKKYQELSDKYRVENEGLTKKLQELASQRKKDYIRFEVKSKLPELKSDYVERLFPFDKVKVNDDGTLTGFNEVLEGFKAEFPEIVGKAGGGEPPPMPPPRNGAPPAPAAFGAPPAGAPPVAGAGGGQTTLRSMRDALIAKTQAQFPTNQQR